MSDDLAALERVPRTTRGRSGAGKLTKARAGATPRGK